MTQDGLRLTLNREVGAPGAARDAISGWLTSLGCPDQLRHDWVLVVSELVTNTVVHTRSPVELTATRTSAGVRVEVYDNDASPPIMREPGAGGAAGGIGLRVVADLSDRWGWEPTTTGKRVWAERLGPNA